MIRWSSGVRVWLLAGVVSVMVIALVLVLIKPPVAVGGPASKRSPTQTASVELAWNGDPLLNEEAGLRDPTPLFLPTRWNASEDALALNAPREPGGSFQSFPPKPAFPEAELKLELPPVVNVPDSAAAALEINDTSRLVVGMGRKEGTLTPLPVRQGFVQVTGADDGQVLLRQSLLETSTPAEGTWQPLEFMVAIDPAGIVRTPVLTESSRVASVDVFFQQYLVSGLHLGERLSPGFYRVNIGP